MSLYQLIFMFIRLCEVMGLNPVPILMSMVIYSNIGGALTPVGDPPNVIIASNSYIAKNVRFNQNFRLFKDFHIKRSLLNDSGCKFHYIYNAYGFWNSNGHGSDVHTSEI